MHQSSAKDTRKPSGDSSSVASGGRNYISSGGGGGGSSNGTGAISRRPVTAASAIIVPVKKNPPLATITNQPRKMDYNQQHHHQVQPPRPASNGNNNFSHCHPSVVVVGVKSKTFHEGSCDGVSATMPTKGHSKLKASLNGGGEVNGICQSNGRDQRLHRDGQGPDVMTTTTNGHHLMSHQQQQHHHHRDAVENVMPLNNHQSNLNGSNILSNNSQRYSNGHHHQTQHVLCNENGMKKDHHPLSNQQLKPKEHQQNEAKDNNGAIKVEHSSNGHGAVQSNGNMRRVRNRSESSEPADEQQQEYWNGGGGGNGRNVKVADQSAPASVNGSNGVPSSNGLLLGHSKATEDNTLKRSREDSTYNRLTTTGQLKSNGRTPPTTVNGEVTVPNGQKPLLTEPLKFSDEWLIEDLESDGRGASDKELISPPAKVVSKEMASDAADEAEQAESEYSSLDDEEEDDFGDETRGNDESLEEDALDAMTIKIGCSDTSLTTKVTMKELQGTYSGCVVGGRSSAAPFSPSLFPNVPLYFSFASHLEAGPTLPPCITKIMKWKLTPVTPVVVRKVLTNTGFRLLKQTNDWMGIWGKHMKSPQFRTIRSYQKFNHIPGSFQIGRKDRVWRNLENQIRRNGKKEFGFMPRTYILPQDLKSLRYMWPKYHQQNVKWIIKPPASARGVGIKVVNRWSQIPKRKPIIVQRYVERPFLIQGSKFDLRLYVLVTSINPLRIYLHTDGLARFASVRYSENAETLNDRYMHLTNYSINKLSSNYAKNEDADLCQGHKWTLRSLWQYLNESVGINTDRLWGTLRNLIIRTLLAGESPINNMTKANLLSKYNCFELFGFDVLLDADLSPWLLEVNISPSLHSASSLDLRVKAPLIQAVLNTAMYQLPPKLPEERQQELLQEMGLPASQMLCHDKRIYTTQLNREERVKHSKFVNKDMTREEYLGSILDDLTSDDVRCLINTEDELARCAPLERIFPAPNTHPYLEFTENPRYYNRLLDAWETKYSKKRSEAISVLSALCEKKVHLEVPANNASARKASKSKPAIASTTTALTPNGRATGGGAGVGQKTSSSNNTSDRRVLPPRQEDALSSSSGPPSESYRESSVESISTTTSTLSDCTSTTQSILPLSTSSSGTDNTRDLVSSSFSSFATEAAAWDEGRDGGGEQKGQEVLVNGSNGL